MLGGTIQLPKQTFLSGNLVGRSHQSVQPDQLDDIISAQFSLDEGWWVVRGVPGIDPEHLPPFKGASSQHIDNLWPMHDGTCVWVSVKLDMRQNGREAKSREDMYCGASGFLYGI